LAAGLATLYASGHRAIAIQTEDSMLCSLLRSEMERSIATPFDELTDSETPLTLLGRSCTSTVSKIAVDLDDDGTVDTNAVCITVAIDDSSLSILRIDSQERIRKH
jgi:hypothetical protein